VAVCGVFVIWVGVLGLDSKGVLDDFVVEIVFTFA